MVKRSHSTLVAAVLTALVYIVHLVPLFILQEDVITGLLYITSVSLALFIRIADVLSRPKPTGILKGIDVLHERLLKILLVVLTIIIINHCLRLLLEITTPMAILCLECISHGVTALGLVYTTHLLYKITLLRLVTHSHHSQSE